MGKIDFSDLVPGGVKKNTPVVQGRITFDDLIPQPKEKEPYDPAFDPKTLTEETLGIKKEDKPAAAFKNPVPGILNTIDSVRKRASGSILNDEDWNTTREYLKKFPAEELKAVYGTDNIEEIVAKQQAQAKKSLALSEAAGEGALGITPTQPQLKSEFPAATTATQIGAGVLPYLLPGGNIAKFTAVPALQEIIGQATNPGENLTPIQRAGRVGVSGVAGNITGRIFGNSDLGKTVFSRVLQKSLGAGATSITESIVKDAISGYPPEVQKALINGGINAASIAILSGITDSQQLRSAVIKEGSRIAGKTVPYEEAVQLVKGRQINPEELSPAFQEAQYQHLKSQAIRQIEKETGRSINDRALKEWLIQKGAEQRAALFDSQAAAEIKHARINGIDPQNGMYARLLPYRQLIISGADPVDLYMAVRLADNLRAQNPAVRTVKTSAPMPEQPPADVKPAAAAAAQPQPPQQAQPAPGPIPASAEIPPVGPPIAADTKIGPAIPTVGANLTEIPTQKADYIGHVYKPNTAMNGSDKFNAVIDRKLSLGSAAFHDQNWFDTEAEAEAWIRKFNGEAPSKAAAGKWTEFGDKLKEVAKGAAVDVEGKVEQKEPWQMTKEEFRESQRKGSEVLPIKTIAKEHISAIKQALSEGKPVPEEVLADYPELKQAAPEPRAAKKKASTDPQKVLEPETAEPRELADFYLKEIKGVAPQAKIPLKEFNVGVIADDVKLAIESDSNDIHVSSKVIKHIADTRPELSDYIVVNFPKLIDTKEIYKNVDISGKGLKRAANSFVFVKRNGKSYSVVVEVKKIEGRNEIVTAMTMRNSTIKKLEPYKVQVGQAGTTALEQAPFRPSAPKASGATPASGFSALQSDNINIPPKEETVKTEVEALIAKNWGVTMPQEPQTDKKINKTDIISHVERSFGVPIRGKVTHRWRNVVGWYQTRDQLIRLKKWGELEPLMHELAHHIDAQMKKSLGEHWRTAQVQKGEKQEVIKELASLDYDQSKRRTSEGFAEYMRHYLTTGQAAQKAPKFHKFFTEVFLKEHAYTAKKIAELKTMLETWQKQGAENRILAQMDFKKEHTDVLRLEDRISKAWDWWNKNFNDEFYLIEKIEKQMGIKPGVNIRPTKDPYAMATYAKSKSGVIARTFVIDKAIDEYGRVLGPGLKEILQPIKAEEMQQFLAYGVAKRAMLLAKRNIESGFDLEDAKYIIEKYKDKQDWNKALEDITQWADHLLGWVIRAGGLGEEEAEIIRTLNPIYLPFKRAFVDEIGVFKGVGSSYVNRGAAVKGIKGSGRPIINPLESLVAQATEMILKAQKVNIAKLIADLAGREGVGGFIVKVPAPLQMEKIDLSKFTDQLTAMGIDISDADINTVLTVVKQDWQYKGKDNIVSFWKDGERVFYELHPDLYKALSGIDQLERGLVMKLLAPFSRLLRLGATGLKISFGLVRNPWRDALSYAVLSKHKTAIPVWDSAKGVFHELTAKPGDLAWRFKQAGGSLSGMLGYDRAATMKVYDELVNAKLTAGKRVIKAIIPKNVPHTLAFLVDQIRAGLNVSELGPRIAELEKSYEKYVKERPDWTEEDAFVAAFNDAQDVTINFTKSGYLGKRINEVVAFFNANLRGIEKTYRAAKEDPVSFLVKGIAWLTLFTILNWLRNKDKQWYKNLPPEYRYQNVFIEVDDQTIIRLPIPFDIGVLFISAPQAALDSLAEKDPKYIESIWKIFSKQIPKPIPSAFQPVADVMMNKNYYGNPIESKSMQYIPVPERKTPQSSGFSIAVSSALSKLGINTLSPVQIDYLLQQYTGGATRQIPQGEAYEISDVSILADVLVDAPDRPKRQINEFYAEWDNLNYKIKTDKINKEERSRYYRLKVVHKTMRRLQEETRDFDKEGNMEKRNAFYKRIESTLEKAGY